MQAVVLRTNEAAWLAGWLAGEMEKRRPGRDTVGVVGGVSFQAVDDFIIGFTAGVLRLAARSRAPRALRRLGDPSKVRGRAARSRAVPGSCSTSRASAARHAAGAAQAGVWGIGVDTDQSGLGPHILTSVVKRYDGVMRTLLEQVRAGRIPGGVTTALSFRDHGATLGRISPKVPASLRAGIAALARQIVTGELRVPGVAPH